MYIKHVTITGADDSTNHKDLLELSLKYPMLEWAILFSENKEGTARYPSRKWREEFYNTVPNVFRSAHLCGGPFLKKFATADETLKKELENYQRLQLNFNKKHVNDDVYAQLVNNTKDVTFKYKDFYPITVITQYNSANCLIHNDFKGQNHAVLFDASGGNGIAPDSLESVIEGIPCGYAGGICPSNIDCMLDKIKDAASHTSIWIDMESGVRTNNVLDLEKVSEVLEKVVQYQLNTLKMDYN